MTQFTATRPVSSGIFSSSSYDAHKSSDANPFSFSPRSTCNYSPSSKAHYKQSARPMQHTDRSLKVATNLARHRNQRNLKVLQNRGGTEEFERILDLMDRRQQDLLQAREAKHFAASQFSNVPEDEFEDEDCCSLFPVQHAQQMERERLQELEERQRQIEAMEAEIEEYSRMAEEEEAQILRDAHNSHAMRQQQHLMMESEAREPWDISDEDVQMSG